VPLSLVQGAKLRSHPSDVRCDFFASASSSDVPTFARPPSSSSTDRTDLFSAQHCYLRRSGTLAQAVDYVAIAILQVGTSFCLLHTRNLLQYRDVQLQETTHDGYMCNGVCMRTLFILIGLSVRVAFYTFARMQSLGYVDDLAFAGKDVCPQMQVVVLVASEV